MRWTIGNATASVALGLVAAAAFVAPPAADARQGVSPFAGSYSGTIPGTSQSFSPIAIATNGGVNASYDFVFWGVAYSGSMSGHVDDAGGLSVKGWTSGGTAPTPGGNGNNGKSADKKYFAVDAAVALDGAGNIVGTTTDGTAFTLVRN